MQRQGSSGTSWWRGAAIYQIYPRSFFDTNGDGVGDLQGCIRQLDYCASLGVDAIWLSPFFKSPMHDFGYDVADYLDVDPLFGALTDFDRLVEEAHARGLRVVIDQVYSHTSDQHAWFQESRRDRTNPKADWYVWADPKPDGSPPNNWQSVFGGGSWQWDARRRQYYLHNFLASQPDLNVHNPAVQDALLDVARFWLDRGVDGFRLDAINFAMHDPELRDNPPADTFHKPPTRPFDFQQHTRNQSHPDIVRFLERLRAVIDGYDDRFTVAEIGGMDALREMHIFTKGDARLNTAYSFDFLYAPELNAPLVKRCCLDWPNDPEGGWPSWAFSNHDAPRAQSRWPKAGRSADFSKMLVLLLNSLRGNVFLYQGEELGLPQGDVPYEKLQDPEAIANWPETLGRDGARTPMPWRSDKPAAGFSTTDPWLPVDARHFNLAVDRQQADPDSVLNFTRRVFGYRHGSPALRLGDLHIRRTPDDLLALDRTHKGEHILCVFNLSDQVIDWSTEDLDAFELVFQAGDAAAPDRSGVRPPPDRLAPWSGYLAHRSRG